MGLEAAAVNYFGNKAIEGARAKLYDGDGKKKSLEQLRSEREAEGSPPEASNERKKEALASPRDNQG
jgi:hypothetical protein